MDDCSKCSSVMHELKIAMNMVHRRADEAVPQEYKQLVTQGQGRIIGFLFFNSHRDIFQRDVEREFSITRATASKMLSLMEKNGLIKRSSVLGDGRLKRLELTDRARDMFVQVHSGMMRFESEMLRGVSDRERRTLMEILKKIEANAQLPGDDGRKDSK